MVDVVTIGESMVLFEPIMGRSLQYSPMLTKTIAGAESNVAIGLTRMGKKVQWISHVGEDPFGRFVLSTLAGEGVDVSLSIVQPQESSAVLFKDFMGERDPHIYYYRKNSATSKMKSADIQPAWFTDARHLHITGITPALGENTAKMMLDVMERAKERGMTISFDPNIRRKLWSEEQARETIKKMIPLCDIFMPGYDECQFLFGEKTLKEYEEILLHMGVPLILIKMGEAGAVAVTKAYTINKAGFKVGQVVDTVGAGDAFASGCLSVLLDEENLQAGLDHPMTIKGSVEQAVTRGNRLGALAVQFKGDWEGLPTLKELQEIERGQAVVSR